MADIKKIAGAIVRLSSREVNSLAQVLATEYGITANETSMVTGTVKKAYRQRSTEKIYVPRKIGKPSKPVLMRRK